MWGIGTELFRRFGLEAQKITSRRTVSSQLLAAHVDAQVAQAGGARPNLFCDGPEQHRSLTTDWVSAKPLPRVLIERMCLEPMRLHQEETIKYHQENTRKKCQFMEALSAERRIVSGAVEQAAHERMLMLMLTPLLWVDLIQDSMKRKILGGN